MSVWDQWLDPRPRPYPAEEALASSPLDVAAVIAEISAKGPLDWEEPVYASRDPLLASARRHADSGPQAGEYQRLGAAYTQAVDNLAAMAQRPPVVLDPWSGADEQAAREACAALASRADRYQLPHHIVLNGVDLRVSPGAGAADVWTGYLAAQTGWIVRVDGDGAVCAPNIPPIYGMLYPSSSDLVDCPRCDGTGEESTFSRRITCEVCEGEKKIPKAAADAEIARRDEERKRWA